MLLTRFFKQEKNFGPTYTGGTFVISKDGDHAYAINDNKVTVMCLESGKVLGQIEEENEDILTIAVAPNQQLIATSNKTSLIRIYQVPQQGFDSENVDLWKPKCVQIFRSQASLALELVFDPSSRFIAAGTSDSQIRVYDV